MKVTSTKPDFVSFTINITVENYKEAEALYFLFNYCPLVDTLSKYGINSSAIRNNLNTDGHMHNEILSLFYSYSKG